MPVETVALSAAATSTGEAAVTGSLWCDANTSGTLTSLYLYQVRRDGTEVGGWTGLSVTCGGTFTATVTPYTSGSFQRGPVQASLAGSYYTADFPELVIDDDQALRMGAAR